MHSRSLNPASVSKIESHSQHAPAKSSTAHDTSGAGTSSAGLILHNSSAAPGAYAAATQVLPVYLVNTTSAVNVPVPSLDHCVYPVTVGSQPVVHRPWLVALPAGMQVSSLSKCQSVLIQSHVVV